MANKIKNCVYVLSDGGPCGKPTHYKMEWDGGEVDSSKVRDYDLFCPEHRQKVDAQEDKDEG